MRKLLSIALKDKKDRILLMLLSKVKYSKKERKNIGTCQQDLGIYLEENTPSKAVAIWAKKQIQEY